MTERPILFSAPMVRAILDGRKTQTRRVVKPVRGYEHNNICKVGMPHSADPWNVWWHSDVTDRVGCMQTCPYGVPGDRLWVRERLNILDWDDSEARLGACVQYAASQDDQHHGVRGWTHHEPGVSMDWGKGKKSIPSIHMPRWASRITLEVMGVRVERLQEISEADARREGAIFHDGHGVGASGYRHDPNDGYVFDAARQSYQRLWDKINGPGSWAANPFCWVIEFRRVAA